MLKQGEPCHIVNTASIAGLLPFGTTAPYQVSKHGVVALSEDLQHDLKKRSTAIGVSVLCPSWVNTRIMEAARTRLADLRNYGETPDLERAAYQERLGTLVSEGMSPERVAEATFEAVRANCFYILPDEEFDRYVRRRMENILARKNPA
jgi:short-subunit dehydrogenase